jgi:DNA-binding response OmpR family regulator
VKLPDIDGFEVCRQIKTNPATTIIPVLHLSASFVESRDKAQGLDSGADAYLAQPVEPIELIATVKSLLRIRRAEESALALAREWQSTFDAMNDGVCLLNQEGRVMRCNSAMTELLSKPFSELVSCLHQELMPTTLGSVEATPFTRVQETRQRESQEVQSGSQWFSVTVDPVFDEGEHSSVPFTSWLTLQTADRRRKRFGSAKSGFACCWRM